VSGASRSAVGAMWSIRKGIDDSVLGPNDRIPRLRDHPFTLVLLSRVVPLSDCISSLLGLGLGLGGLNRGSDSAS